MNKTSLIEQNFLSFIFSEGDIRKIKIRQQEVIQRIYFVVRDEEWLNIPFVLKNYKSKVKKSKTEIEYQLLFLKESVNFEVNMKITSSDDLLLVETNGESASDFMKNRIGLCMHLPVSLKGKACKIFHSDATLSSSVFPELVSPHQPFKNISGVEYEMGSLSVKIEFEGDVFEMEDQRNWTDASYKIYSTPLDLPFPVQVKKGDTFYQKIAISFSDAVPNNRKKHIKLPTTEYLIPAPQIGIQLSNDFSSEKTDYLATNKSPFSYYRVDFHLYDNTWRECVQDNISFLRKANLPIYAVLYFSEHYEKEINDFTAYIESHSLGLVIHSVVLLSSTVFVVSNEKLEYLSAILRAKIPNILIGAGTDANFAQLNRNRPDTEHIDFLCYSIQPQEHASDKLSLIENIQGQSDTVKTALSFSNGKKIHIAALSFYRRFNANVHKILKDNVEVEYEYSGSNFEAAWFIGSLHQLIVANAEGITCVFSIKENCSILQIFNYLASNEPESFYSQGSFLPEEYSFISWKSKAKKHSIFANLKTESLRFTHHGTKKMLSPYEILYEESDLPF